MGGFGGTDGQGFEVNTLFDAVQTAVEEAKTKIGIIKDNKESISIADMFEMQMLMNHLSQLSEMTTNVVNASHSAISSMARNVKG